MIKTLVFGMALLSTMQFTHAEVDWTPKLTVLQDSCSDIFQVMDELPQKYQASIIKKGDISAMDTDGNQIITTTYNLKEATAFNLPLAQIKEEVIEDYFHWKSFSMVFKDNAFLKLRPSFYYTAQSNMAPAYRITADMPQSGKYRDVDAGIDVKYKNTILGYEVEDNGEGMSCTNSLHFDKASKSLSCTISCG